MYFYVYCVTVDTLVVVWLNFGVCMYVYEDSTIGSFCIPYVYAYAHIWLKHQSMRSNHNKVANTRNLGNIYQCLFLCVNVAVGLHSSIIS